VTIQATALVLHELMCCLSAYVKNNVVSSPFIGDTGGYASANPASKMSLKVQLINRELLSSLFLNLMRVKHSSNSCFNYSGEHALID
jgi:hypothetical protein